MGWDYETFLNQPNWLIEIAGEFLNSEAKSNDKR